MDRQFDELSKSLAEKGVSRKEALRKIGIGLAGVLLAAVGLSNGRHAGAQSSTQCCSWSCTSPGRNKPEHIKTCGSPCLNPSNPGQFYFCTLDKSTTVSDCTACKGS
jgi:hypothetical protein